MMTGERNMIRAGFRWDVIADFPDNSCGVRVATRKTRHTARRFAKMFYQRNRPYVEDVFVRLRHDRQLDKRSKRR